MGEEESGLFVQTDLQGVALDLPGAYAKPAVGQRNFELDWQFAEPYQPMMISVAETGLMTLGFKDYQFDGAVIQLSGEKESGQSAGALLASMREDFLYVSDSLTFTGSVALLILTNGYLRLRCTLRNRH